MAQHNNRVLARLIMSLISVPDRLGFSATPENPNYSDANLPKWLIDIKDDWTARYKADAKEIDDKIARLDKHINQLPDWVAEMVRLQHKREELLSEKYHEVWTKYESISKSLETMETEWMLNSLQSCGEQTFKIMLSMLLESDKKASPEAIKYFQTSDWLMYYGVMYKYGSIADAFMSFLKENVVTGVSGYSGFSGVGGVQGITGLTGGVQGIAGISGYGELAGANNLFESKNNEKKVLIEDSS